MSGRSLEGKPPRRIVVGYDGSSPSFRAVRFALSLLRDPEVRIWLVHAAAPSRVVAEPRTEEETSAETGALRSTLERTARSVDPTGDRVQAWTREGSPEVVLLAAAAEVDADLIVVGTRGLRGAERVVLGSVSEKVVSRSGRPVTVVP